MDSEVQTLVLKSHEHYGSKPPSSAIGEVLRLVQPAVRYSIRMAFEGRSTLRGVRPSWLERASDVRFVGHGGEDETTLLFEAPRLSDAAPKLYEQQEMWTARPDPEDTGFDLLGDVVEAVAKENADSDRFDNPLLRRIGKFDHALNGTFQSIDIVARRYLRSSPAIITPQVIDVAKRFTNTTPHAQAARVFGRLDMIRASTQSFALKLASGEEVRGVVDGFDIDQLLPMFRKPVLVLGKAVYRPSGRLLRIDATDVRASNEKEQFFSKVPLPKLGKVDRKPAIRPSRAKGGVAAIFGKWPGDETDAQIEAALREIS